MHNQLIEYIAKENLIAKGEKVLLAVSGGIDSIVMCHLFAQTDFTFGIAHCNFALRGEESNGDAAFVEKLAKEYNVDFHLNNCNASSYAKENKISIQMAARDLRFSWFEELREKEDYSVYATAHHADDAIETYFINQLRGTGIAGLHGIAPKNGKLIHPLLYTNRTTIEQYVQDKKLSYREDSSNKSTKYLRNSLRHRVLPVFDEVQPAFREIILQNMQRFNAIEKLYLEQIQHHRNHLCREEKNQLKIQIGGLLKLKEAATYLFEFIKKAGFQFSQAQEVVQELTKGIPGAQYFSNTHILLRDREDLILSKRPENKYEYFVLIGEDGEINEPLNLCWETIVHPEIEKNKKMAFLDFDKLHFPLQIRKWKQGDYFVPFGMKGKKLLSDFFIDQKFNLFEKQNTWLLTSGEDIVWVIGHRIDDRYCISDSTGKTLKISLA